MSVTTPRFWNGYRWVDLAAGGDRGAPLPHQTEPADAFRPRAVALAAFREESLEPAAPELREDRRRPGFDVSDSGPTLEEASRKFTEIEASFGAVPRVPISIGGTVAVLEETPVAQILQFGADPKR